MHEPDIIASIRRAVAAAPEDLTLRLHLAELLLRHGDTTQAVREAAHVLEQDPSSQAARSLLARALGTEQAEGHAAPEQPASGGEFDWTQAERELGDLAVPTFREPGLGPQSAEASAFDVESSDVRLADVGGMDEAKARLEASFLAPMRNPDLQRFYGKRPRGGLLMFGPPGCGKTFLARAVAGELEAAFVHVSLVDVLDMWLGTSERNLHELFEVARRNAPCVLFLDEIDALGQKRTNLRSSAMRTTVNQLLEELDGVSAANDGLFVLAATNQPWDVDPALRRPGRFDRTVLVLPPDEEARVAILSSRLRARPVAGVDVRDLARRTDGFSGADLVHLCETAAEHALMDSVRSGTTRDIGPRDFQEALREVRPSTGPWFDSARNVAMFANQNGEYDGVLTYLNRKGRR